MTPASAAGPKLLGAVGTLVWDRILNPYTGGAPAREQWGGAVYSYTSLAAACPPGWMAVPIVKIGHDLEAEARDLLASLPNLRLGPAVRGTPAPNNRVELRYQDPVHRVEVQSGGVPSWTWAELEPVVQGLDAIYINYLSGQELELATTLRLRDRFPGPLFADLHSLFLTAPGPRPRRPRPLPDWQAWLSCFDAVQLNESELRLLADGADPEDFALSIPEHGPGLALITLGEGGVRYVVREGFPVDPLEWPAATRAGGVRTGVVLPPGGRVPGDATGCGDVWGAAFIAGALGGLELEPAIQRAQCMAAAKIRHPDTRGLLKSLQRERCSGEPR